MKNFGGVLQPPFFLRNAIFMFFMFGAEFPHKVGDCAFQCTVAHRNGPDIFLYAQMHGGKILRQQN